MYPYFDFNKLHSTTSSSVWIHMAEQMSFAVHPAIHTSCLGMWCSSLPFYASKISSRESQGLGGDYSHSSRSLLSCQWDLVQLCHRGPGSQHRPRSKWRGHDSPLGEAHLSPLRIQELLGKQAPILKTLQLGETNSNHL